MMIKATEKRDVVVDVTIEQMLDGLFSHYGFDRWKNWLRSDKSVIRNENQYHNHVEEIIVTEDPKRVRIFKALKELENAIVESK